jgi:periplasmic divalent cation tolerance protein
MTPEDSPPPGDFILVFVTAPDPEVAGRLARTLVEERLVACVTLHPQVRSVYWWEGKVCDEAETLCVAKTRATHFADLRARILALHPYQVPEIIAVPLVAGHPAYLEWITRETRPVPA